MSEKGIGHLRLSAWPDAQWEVRRLDYSSLHDGFADWALWMNGRAGGDLAVVLHGHGSGGDQLFVRPDIRQSWLPALQVAGISILCPNLRGNAWMSPAAVHDLRGLMAWAKGQCHPRRTFICGGSMGGTSALIYTAIQPAGIDGVLALCPAADLPGYWKWASERKNQSPTLKEIVHAIESAYGATPDQAPALFQQHSAAAQWRGLTMPVALVHGTADALIPSHPTRDLARKLGERAPVRYVELDGGDHDAPLALFPELLGWLMARA